MNEYDARALLAHTLTARTRREAHRLIAQGCTFETALERLRKFVDSLDADEMRHALFRRPAEHQGVFDL